MKTIFLMMVLLSLPAFIFCQEEITITTYYPSPYGSYNELLVSSRQAIGNVDRLGNVDSDDLAEDNFGLPVAGSLTVARKIGIGTKTPIADSDGALDVVGELLAGSGNEPTLVNIMNTDIEGASSIDFFDNNGDKKGWVGYGNTMMGTGLPQGLRNRVFLGAHDDEDVIIRSGANAAILLMAGAGDVRVGVGTAAPQARLDVAGGIKVGYVDDAGCNIHTPGTFRYNSGSMEYCDGTEWKKLAPLNPTLHPCSDSDVSPGSTECDTGIAPDSGFCSVTAFDGTGCGHSSCEIRQVHTNLAIVVESDHCGTVNCTARCISQ
ncbi:MAG: hypothetical protein AB1481_02740 [Candidatus Omnitrophota bacterium]